MSEVEQVRPIEDVVTAVKTAQQYFQTLLPAQAQGALLEEVEAPEHSREWKVTFSTPSTGLAVFTGVHREYKVVTIDANTGSFRSMKIRVV